MSHTTCAINVEKILRGLLGMNKIKEMLHCLQLDSRIRHNIKYAQREWFFSYFKHFRKDLNMPLLNSIKQAKGISKTILEKGYMPDIVHDSVMRIRYSRRCNTRVCRAARND